MGSEMRVSSRAGCVILETWTSSEVEGEEGTVTALTLSAIEALQLIELLKHATAASITD